MDEQSKPPRRARMAGDAERALIGRTHRVDNVPAFVDPASEVSASVLMAAQLDVQGERLDRITDAVSGYTAQLARQQETLDGLVVPSVKSLLAFADQAGRASERTAAKLERNEELLQDIAATLKDLVTRVARLEHSRDSLEGRLAATESAAKSLDTRVKALEQTGRDSLVRVDERKRILTWGKAALFGAGGAVAAIAEQLGLFG